MKKLFFISMNSVWGGSEELWVRTCQLLAASGFKVIFSARYESVHLQRIGGARQQFFLQPVPRSIVKRGINKILGRGPNQLEKQLLSERPDLVIFSQGDPFGSVDAMKICCNLSIPYVTITQLVGEWFFPLVNHLRYHNIQIYFGKAVKNYFVSKENIHLFRRMTGCELSNGEVVYNPCKVRGLSQPHYPVGSTHSIALVGRLDFFHKGHDLFLEVVKHPKWQGRNVRFNVYGDGTHRELLQLLIKRYNINNVVLHTHVENVIDIWASNQLLFMPSRMEGQALSLIEAMWCERAAIVTDVGGATELITDGINGFVSHSFSIKDLDETLERAWQQRDRWQEMGREAGKTIREKHPQDEVKFFADKIKEIVGV